MVAINKYFVFLFIALVNVVNGGLVLKTLQVAMSDSLTQVRSGMDSLGDIYTWSRDNKIYLTDSLDEIDNTTLIGDNEGYCIRLTNEGDFSKWTCSYTIYLPQGQLTADGPWGTESSNVSITGGTGALAGASGYMELVPYPETLDGTFVYAYNFFLGSYI